MSDDGVVVDGTDATREIRTREVTEAVSAVAANTPVREELRARQRQWADARGGGVIEGRDIGTVVFPDATLKLFVTASPQVRAERRVAELGGHVDDVAASIAERDRRDMTRADGPLRAADGAAVVDTTGLTIDEVVERIIELLPADPPMTGVDTFLAGQGRASRVFYGVTRAFVTGFTRLWTRLELTGREHVPTRGAFVLAPVHRSNMDTPIVACVTRRRLRFMGKDSLWKQRPVAWLLSALGGFPVSRGTADREALQRCIAVLEAGEPLVLFPEGERKSGEIVQPLFDGAVYVALKAGVPIVPVGIGGSEAVMPKGAQVHPSGEGARDRRRADPCRRRRWARDRSRGAAIRELTAELHETLQQLYDDASPMIHPSASCGASPHEALGRSEHAMARSAGQVRGQCRGEPGRVVDAAELARRVHRQLRHADVDGGDAEAGGRQRTDRRAARHVVARDEHLVRHAGAGARLLEQHRGVGRRGVALVGVELDRRAVVDERRVLGIVALRRSSGARRGRCRPTRSSTRPACGGGRRVIRRRRR